MIYSAFRWSVAQKAYPKTLEMAKKHKVKFYDASGDGNVMFPNETWKIRIIY